MPAFGGSGVGVRKQRKVYFADCGLLSSLGEVSSGARFENAVYQNLRLKGEVFYYQKRAGEIDFIFKKGGEVFAFEAKQKATPSDLKRLERRASCLGVKKFFLISQKFTQVAKSKYLFQLASL